MEQGTTPHSPRSQQSLRTEKCPLCGSIDRAFFLGKCAELKEKFNHAHEWHTVESVPQTEPAPAPVSSQCPTCHSDDPKVMLRPCRDASGMPEDMPDDWHRESASSREKESK
jgi:hypothetical protein